MKELDMVELVRDVPDHKLERGRQGTIVHVYPEGAFEVEFPEVPSQVVTLKAHDLRPAPTEPLEPERHRGTQDVRNAIARLIGNRGYLRDIDLTGCNEATIRALLQAIRHADEKVASEHRRHQMPPRPLPPPGLGPGISSF